MSMTQIVCANCGAKYKLPESFRGDRAKCKKCGAVIDVAAQRAAAASPAAAEPRKPERSASRERPGRRGAAAGASRRTSAGTRRRKGKEEEAAVEESSSRSRRSRERKKDSSTVVLVGSAVGVLAVVVVVLIYLLNQGGEATTDETARNTSQPTPSASGGEPKAKGTAEDASAQNPQQATPAATETAEAGREAPAAKEGAKGAGADREPEGGAKAKTAKAKTAEKRRGKKKLESRADVFDPKKELQPLEWPDIYDEAHRKRVAQLIEQIRDGGFMGARAKRELEEMGHGALVGIINALREVDYFDPEQTMFAYELNRLLQTICVEIINTQFRPQELDAKISLQDADWNAKTVKAWQRLWERYKDPADFKRLIKKLRSRHVGK